jgi:hypothetical protein
VKIGIPVMKVVSFRECDLILSIVLRVPLFQESDLVFLPLLIFFRLRDSRIIKEDRNVVISLFTQAFHAGCAARSAAAVQKQFFSHAFFTFLSVMMHQIIIAYLKDERKIRHVYYELHAAGGAI